MRRAIAIAGLVLAALAPAASADHSVLELVSTGPSAQPCPPGASDQCRAVFSGASADGRRALIRTKQPLVPSDSNDTDDVYEWSDGSVRRISHGLTSAEISRDGSSILFTTNSALLPEDTDGAFADAYELTGNALRLISAAPAGSGAAHSAAHIAFTRDSDKVFFRTTEALVPADADATSDIYERDGNTLELVTAGLELGSGGYAFAGASDDGSRVFFTTSLSMVPEDADSGTDAYQRAGGQTRLVSGPQTPDDGFFFSCCLVSADGTKAAFSTPESLLPEDMDGWSGCVDDMEEFVSCGDVYRWDDGNTTLVSRPQTCTSLYGCYASIRGMSEDGSRVLFTTQESYAAEDTNGSLDLYEWDSGVISLVSVGPNGAAGNLGSGATVAASRDLEKVFFTTSRSLTPDDLDSFREDVYLRFNGTTTLMSAGTAGEPACCTGNIFITGASADGASVFAETLSTLAPQDSTSAEDLYELTTTGPTLLSTGPYGQGVPQQFGAFATEKVSEDGDRVLFQTTAAMVPQDTDTQTDIYMSRRVSTAGHPRPKGATPFRVPLVPAAKQCLAPNRQHGPPLAFGSCNPVQPESPNLTVGVGDGSPALARSSGSVRLEVVVGAPGGPDDSDVYLAVALTNVMNKPTPSDYTGELRAEANARLTDRVSGVPSSTDFSLGFTVPCTATADTTLGGDCRILTSLDAVVPGGAAEGTRAIWALDRWKVHDGGPDADAETAGDNSLLAVQGLFVP